MRGGRHRRKTFSRRGDTNKHEGVHRGGDSLPMRFFGYFLSVQKVTRGTGPEAPKMSGPGARDPVKVRRAGPRNLPANVITPFSP